MIKSLKIIYLMIYSISLIYCNDLRDLTTTAKNPPIISTDSSAMSSTGSLNNNVSTNIVKIVTYTDYNSFTNDCGNTKPTKPIDCTTKKYEGYWCCHVDYIASSKTSYCAAYADQVAKTKTNSQDVFFSYTCPGEYLCSLVRLFIFMIIFLIF